MTPIQNSNTPKRKVLLPRRLTLLASVAGLGMAVLLTGPGGFQPLHGWSSAAQAAETVQHPSGFGDLVAKVKPAVISVRVNIEQTANNTSGDDDENMQPFMQGAPLQKFFKQFGQRMPNGAQRHYAITGEGSGFFISSDGYAVTNFHVVDHAKTVAGHH